VEGYRHDRWGKPLARFATEAVPMMERAFGMPLEQVHAGRVAVPRQRVAAAP
jgi:hypothetical protein